MENIKLFASFISDAYHETILGHILVAFVVSMCLYMIFGFISFLLNKSDRG